MFVVLRLPGVRFWGATPGAVAALNEISPNRTDRWTLRVTGRPVPWNEGVNTPLRHTNGLETCETTFTLYFGLSFKVTTLFRSPRKAKNHRGIPCPAG